MFEVTNQHELADLTFIDDNGKVIDLVSHSQENKKRLPKMRYGQRGRALVTVTMSEDGVVVFKCTCRFPDCTGLGLCRHIAVTCSAIDVNRGEDEALVLNIGLINSHVLPYWHNEEDDFDALQPKSLNDSSTTIEPVYQSALKPPLPTMDTGAMFAYIVNGMSEGKSAVGKTPAWLHNELRKISEQCFAKTANPWQFVGAPIDTRNRVEKLRTNRFKPSTGPTSGK